MNESVIKEVVPFNQFRLLVLFMEAAKQNDQAKIRRVQEEAASVGIKISFGGQAD